MLCNPYGDLSGYSSLMMSLEDLEGLEDGHTREEYCRAFKLVFPVKPDSVVEGSMLFIPGADDATLYGYGATFPAPDRRLVWQGTKLWIADTATESPPTRTTRRIWGKGRSSSSCISSPARATASHPTSTPRS